MNGRLRARWDNLLATFWFVPGAVALGFAALAWTLIALDRLGPGGFFVYGGTGSAARTILQTIATSLITVAGVSFSLTIVTLQLVSQQFTPRATRTFLADRTTQVAAGIFIGIFLYCLLAIRSVRDDEEGGAAGFVPGLTINGGIVLGVVGLATLLVFINRIAQSIKVDNITARMARDGLRTIDDLYPDPYGRAVEDDPGEVRRRWCEEHGEPGLVHADRPGYVQSLGLEEIAEGLGDSVRRLELRVHPGDFVTERTPVAEVWPAPDEEKEEDAVRSRVLGAVVIDSERDVGQDLAFSILQLSDVALRAMSPSVNDPTTAITCIGYLTAVLEQLAGRALPSPLRRYGDRDFELLAHRPAFEAYVRGGYEQLGRVVAGEPRAARALLDGLEAVLRALESRPDARAEVCGLAFELRELLVSGARTDAERAALARRLDRIEALAGDGRDVDAAPFTGARSGGAV